MLDALFTGFFAAARLRMTVGGLAARFLSPAHIQQGPPYRAAPTVLF